TNDRAIELRRQKAGDGIVCGTTGRRERIEPIEFGIGDGDQRVALCPSDGNGHEYLHRLQKEACMADEEGALESGTTPRAQLRPRKRRAPEAYRRACRR